LSYSDLLRMVNVADAKVELVELVVLKAQYNPERFGYWQSLHKGPPEQVLNMNYSPHIDLLKNIGDWQNTSYYEMHRLYGREHKWIEKKIIKFIELFYNIDKIGYTEKIVVLRRPLIVNPYNNSFEIYEGHHRVACLLYLNYLKIPVLVWRRDENY
jgi:hypothetical protein